VNVLIYLSLFVLSFFLTYLIKNYAIKKSLLAIPNDRSSHSVPTPHGGGIAIALSWFFGLGYLYATNNIEPALFYALSIGIIISATSYFDDLFEISPKIRLLVQSGVALGGIIVLGGIEELDLWVVVLDNQIVTSAFAFLLIIWFINLYNFLDGIDGYAGSEALFLALAGVILYGDSHFLVLIAAVSGFLVWNWEKAKIFMGDVGSTLLGYNIAIFTLYYTNQESSNLWVWIILFGVFWVDATLTLLRRYRNKEKLSHAHRKHAYQRITQIGWSHQKTVISAMLINFLGAIPLLWLFASPFLPFYCIIYCLLLYLFIRIIDKAKPF
jgi:UDP-N-acetylmuramyl pentapeptide phosphotransferase/UDP-N-acetylglucosamine-1-phosphate transferase